MESFRTSAWVSPHKSVRASVGCSGYIFCSKLDSLETKVIHLNDINVKGTGAKILRQNQTLMAAFGSVITRLDQRFTRREIDPALFIPRRKWGTKYKQKRHIHACTKCFNSFGHLDIKYQCESCGDVVRFTQFSNLQKHITNLRIVRCVVVVAYLKKLRLLDIVQDTKVFDFAKSA